MFLINFTVRFDNEACEGELPQLKVTRIDARTPIIGIDAGIGNQAAQKIAEDSTG